MGPSAETTAGEASEVNRHPMPCRYYRHYLIRRLVSRLDFSADGRFLDIGCGSGNVLQIMAELGLKGIGVDMSPEAIEIARQVVAGKGIETIIGDFRALDEQYELILAVELIEHLEDDVGALRWMRDHLRDGGHLVVACPGGSELYGERDRALGHFRRYDRRQLREKLMSAGLVPQVLWTFGPRITSRIFRLLAGRASNGAAAQPHGTTRTGYAYQAHENALLSRLWPLYGWMLPLTRLQNLFLRARLLDANCIALCAKSAG